MAFLDPHINILFVHVGQFGLQGDGFLVLVDIDRRRPSALLAERAVEIIKEAIQTLPGRHASGSVFDQ
jgi:hypothetical protein